MNTASRQASIKQRFIVISLVVLLLILLGGSIAFILSMRRIVHDSISAELGNIIEIERINLESSVKTEIGIAIKMADSPLIKRYFMNPLDSELEAIAFEEIAGYRRAFAANTVFWVNNQDLKFYSDDAYVMTIDTSDPNNYWYLMTLLETEVYNFNINYNPDLDVTNLWINAPVFDDAHNPIGILGTGIDLTSFIDSIYENYSGSAALYFFNEFGEITGAKNQSLVTEKITFDAELGETGAMILDWAKNNTGNEIYTFTSPIGEVSVGLVPALGWHAAAIQPLSIADYLNTNMTTLFAIIAIFIVLIFIIFNISIVAVLRPLNGMVKALDQISTNWDLTKRLTVHKKDEIGTLAFFLNQTFERIRELLKSITDEANLLSDTGEDLATNMTETAATINEINSHIQNMKDQIQIQTGNVNATGGGMERIIGGLDKLNDHIASQVESVEQSSSAIEQMLANIRAVTGTLIKNSDNINSLAESSEKGRSDLQTVSQDIQEIARESEGLLEINSVMENIASQTNLLSMNAAIEAAHAGEAGKGFAVVADEIRKLAVNSSGQSKTISDVLKKIKSSIDTITKSTKVVLERFEAIAGDVGTVSDQETQIRNAMEEQEAGSRQILEAVGHLNSITSLVKSASGEMANESREVKSESSKLIQINEVISKGMDEMAKGANQINVAVNEVNKITLANKQNIDSLNGKIVKFKVG